ncbi:Uncharacterised protein [Kingella denitrificans]|uniref:Uncharacterized protein n=1 Tax=Kingella denitrificans ATCC 33394 TaxID=888741 RepID=F0F2B2_9NEIS|nr:hypothetical protein [Kingella denitrificans]EGC16412.1 hypothetical protein HMPREF9098_2247 [Kingella denitrificans ATCC 33394]STR11430.1 Uncharacterised protein [Kingella denitrificans]
MQTQRQRILAVLTRGETLTVRQIFENLHINCPTINYILLGAIMV